MISMLLLMKYHPSSIGLRENSTDFRIYVNTIVVSQPRVGWLSPRTTSLETVGYMIVP